MNIMVVYSPESRASDISGAFEECGCRVTEYEQPVKTFYEQRPEWEQIVEELTQRIVSNHIEVCFSWNYLSALSEACEQQGIPYLSWSYDSPVMHIFSANMYNSCNYIFVFDRCFYEELKEYKLPHLFYLPLGVNSGRLKNIKMTQEQLAYYRRDISLVGNLYEDNLFDIWAPQLPQAVVDKVGDIFCRQFNNWSENVIYRELDGGFLRELGQYIDMSNVREQFPYISERVVYGGLVLSRKFANVERTCILTELAEHFPVTLYTYRETPQLPRVENRGSLDYRTQMPLAFCASRINLNFTLKSIESGLPLRLFDIMGCGGFAVTNRQAELEEYFEPGRDFIVFDSVEELMDKVGYYLRHESERIQILKSGYRKVHAEHNYGNRVRFMLREAGLMA